MEKMSKLFPGYISENFSNWNNPNNSGMVQHQQRIIHLLADVPELSE